jgi:hypothetical protein
VAYGASVAALAWVRRSGVQPAGRADAYELTLAQRREVAEAILSNHDWSCAIITDAADAGHTGFGDYWNDVAGTMARATLVLLDGKNFATVARAQPSEGKGPRLSG